MNTVLLLVTWLSAGIGASSYQIEFPKRDLCEHAQAAILRDVDRIRAQFGPATPTAVSAVCVDQQK